MLKIGIDIHGVATDKKEFFQEFTKAMVKAGIEVHFISGPPKEKIEKELIGLGMSFTHIFSIIDYHQAKGTHMWADKEGNLFLDEYLWDKTKADYCLNEGIDLHFDDSDAYGYFFKTPYARFYSKNKREHYVRKS